MSSILEIVALHGHQPGVATDLAVLDEAAVHVRFNMNLSFLTAVRTRHHKVIVHAFQNRWRVVPFQWAILRRV
jgi:hypothetical protein